MCVWFDLLIGFIHELLEKDIALMGHCITPFDFLFCVNIFSLIVHRG